MSTDSSAPPFAAAPGSAGLRPAGPVGWAVLVLLGLAVVVPRLLGVGWGLPEVHHPDEITNFNVAGQMAHDGTADPRFFNYPSLLPNVLAVNDRLDRDADDPAHTVDLQEMGTGQTDRPEVVLRARILFALISALIVAVAGAIAWELARSRLAVAVTVGLLAWQPIALRYASWAIPDGLGTLWATVAVYASIRLARTGGSAGAWLLAGAAVGLAGGAKYNLAVAGGALALAALARRDEGWTAVRHLALAALAAVVVFLLTTPYAVLTPEAFLDGVRTEMEHYATGHTGAEGDTLRTNLGWLWSSTGPLLLLVPAVLLVAWRRPAWWGATGFLVVYMVVISTPVVRFERNLLPLLPTAMALVSAAGVVWLARSPAGDPRRWLAAGVVAVSLLGWTVPAGLDVVRAFLDDERAEARAWIEEHVEPGTTVLVESYGPYLADLDLELRTTAFVVRDEVDLDDVDVVVTTVTGSGRFLDEGGAEAAAYEALVERRCEGHAFDGRSPLGEESGIVVHRLVCPPQASVDADA